ncbi:MAG TPA: protein sphX [Oscillatoriales bacterium UBA8482]|nr:MAG: protein sphX [Oscillatoriales cyanobacterium CG2_30_40_61]HBW56647.1 protein sphX [Oscillatoriales bacterium UBA8482]
MTPRLLKSPSSLKTFVLAVGTATLLLACAQGQTKQVKQTKPILIDGSSTVYPITAAIVKEYNAQSPAENLDVKVDFSGTGGGFRKFCAGETDISNASRPILKAEIEVCKKNNISYLELPVAFDALTIVVNPKNTWANDITVAELKKLWEPQAEGKIKTWNQIRASWPNQPINLYGPGRDSGTFDYFTAAVVGEEKASRNDYQGSEDDEIIAKGVMNDPNGLGYFGYAYYQERPRDLKALAVDNQKGSGPIIPSSNATEIENYRPLARPLFIYVNAVAAQDNPAMNNFLDFYMQKAPKAVKNVGYIAFEPDDYLKLYRNFHKTKVGTVFGGKSEFNLTLDEVLVKRAEY